MKSGMKAIALQGSYRKNGVTTGLLKYACERLSLAGYEVTYFDLYEKKIDYCKGCRKCLETRECIFKDDDMPEITEKIKEADVVLLAAPVYWANVPAAVKNMFDRLLGVAMEETNAFPKPRLSGKRYILITACHTRMPFAKWCGQTTGLIRAVSEFFKTAGIKKAGHVICANTGTKNYPVDKKHREIDRIIDKL